MPYKYIAIPMKATSVPGTKQKNEFIKTYKPISLGAIVLNNKTIPKIVYVVNVFDEEPMWYKCCVRSIQKMNPDFQIKLLTFTEQDFFNTKYIQNMDKMFYGCNNLISLYSKSKAVTLRDSLFLLKKHN